MNGSSRLGRRGTGIPGYVLLLAIPMAGLPALAFAQNAPTSGPPVPAQGPAAASSPATTPPATAQTAADAGQPKTDSSSGRVVVPRETTIPLQIQNAISSKSAYVGQAVYCETIYPITVGNRIVIPVGSYVKGTITQVIRPGHVKGKAQIGLRFDSLTLPDGVTHDLRATLSSYAGNGKEGFKRDEGKIEGESTKGHDVGTVASTAGEGAIIGAIAGRGVKGAGIGGGAGALGGLIWVLASRGKDILIPERTTFELQLTAPLEFDPGEIPPASYSSGPALPRRDPGPPRR
ncbi:MAG TPA: hypothetical protein VKU44_05345 [Terriglobia bacterium]|nr:hypothetical protein [Terriglobia bacterium]